MAFQTSIKGDFLVLTCPEEIDSVAGKQIDAMKNSWLENKKNMALDLRKVTFIDSDGFRALTLLARKLKEAGLKLVSLNPSPSLVKAIKKAGLENTLNPIVQK